MGFLLVRRGGAWRRLSPIAGYAFLGGLVRRAIDTPHFFTKKRRHLKEDASAFSLSFRRKSRIFSGEVREILDDIALQHICRGRELLAFFPRKADVARAARRGDRHQRDMVAADTVPCDARREGYTEAGADEFAYRHRAVALEYHMWDKACHAAVEVCDGTKGRACFQRNESRFLKFIQIDR